MGYDDAIVKNSIAEALRTLKNEMNSKLKDCAFKEGVPKGPLWEFIREQGFEAVFTQCPTRCGVSNQGIGRIQIDDDDHNIFLTKISTTYLFFKDKTIWKYLKLTAKILKSVLKVVVLAYSEMEERVGKAIAYIGTSLS